MEVNLSKCLSCEALPAFVDAVQQANKQQSMDVIWMKEQVHRYKESGHFDRNLFSEEAELEEKVEKILMMREKSGDKHALFLLGQFYLEQGFLDKAREQFLKAVNQHDDWQSMYQLGVIYFDGLGVEENPCLGFQYMYKVATSTAKAAKHLVRFAQFNVGLAHYLGVGAKFSTNEAERFWLMAADDGNPRASIKAQTTLGLFYSTEGNLDLKKAFYYHTEACGNGSLESQGILGVMYMNGLGRKQDDESAFICLRDAARRGNVFATGHLVAYYYKHKLFTKALNIALRVSLLEMESVNDIARDTGCLPLYIKKGIAIACFYYARCLTLGQATAKDSEEAQKYYSKCYKFDLDICNTLQKCVQLGEI